MRSIRLSLIVYFLFLLAAAFGAVSWFVYQTTWHTLQAKEAAARQHLEQQYARECAQKKSEFDRKLLRRAQEIDWRVRGTWHIYEAYVPLCGAWAAGWQPMAAVAVPLPLISGQMPDPGKFDAAARERFWDVYHPMDIHMDVDEEPGPEGQDHAQELFRTYTAHGKPLHFSHAFQELATSNPALSKSFSLPTEAVGKAESFRSRPFRPPGPGGAEARQIEERARSLFDEVEVQPGVRIRRVTWIGMIPGFRIKPGIVPPPTYWRLSQNRIAAPAKNAKGSPPPRGWTNRVLIVQFASASNTREREASLQALQATLQETLAKQEAERLDTLTSLRRRLWWIFAATFVALIAGGYWLVCLGLSPLQRLSEAVSRVSVKDFRLQVEGRMPVELRPIAARLTETLDQLKRAFAREKQAAADISHELRTPLAALLTTLEVGLRKRRTPEEYEEILEDCRSSGKQMTQLVERLLALARLDAGVDQLRLREVDVAGLASQCAELVRPLADARGLAVHLHASGQTTLKADPDKLREVVTNLLHNAIEYNKPNGSIDVAVARDNGHVRLEVRDTGIGIAPEAREHIFERFYRADPSRHADTLHAGIGLAIVKGYVDLMGGNIGVESSSAGSTFRIDFPAL